MSNAPRPVDAKFRPQRHAGLTVNDVLFVLFRHKWKILLSWVIGLAAALAVVYLEMRSPLYESRAKLLVRYVLERSAVDPYESKADAAGTRGMAVMDAEIEIIKSSDLAVAVARKIGPGKIIHQPGVPATDENASLLVSQNLKVTAARGSNVIQLAYQHPNPEVTVGVLKNLIDTYFEKHLEIHRSTGAFENVARQTDKARSQLNQTEAELGKLTKESGFLSISDARKSLESRRSEMRASLIASQIALEEQRTRVQSLEKQMKPAPAPTEPARGPSETEAGARQRADQRYQDLAERLNRFKQRRNDLLITRKPGDPMIQSLDSQIAEIQREGLDLIEQFPGLAGRTASHAPAAPGDLAVEQATLNAMETKTRLISEQLKPLEAEIEKLAASSLTFANLERRRQMEEEKYRYYETSLEKARVDEALNPASMPNIGVVQSPSAPMRSIPSGAIRLGSALASAGLLLGLAMAFISEWVLNRRITRPLEIQTRLQLPLMMAIPRIRTKDTQPLRLTAQHAMALPPAGRDGTTDSDPEPADRTNPHANHFIMPYAGAIRDRIMFGFEVNNITHKPKLIGLTSLTHGAGTTSLATAMANAFAENGRFKVLLVDLDTRQDRGREAIPLQAAIEHSRTLGFRLEGRSLFHASAPTQPAARGVAALASVTMHELMPQLAACDYDYVIFDMPPVAPTSPTVALAGFMDKVLLILDAENTNRESLSWCYAELEKGGADISCVFNKARDFAPRWLTGETPPAHA